MPTITQREARELTKLLLIEDDVVDRELVERALEKEAGKYRVAAVDSLAKGIDALSEQAFDIVLLDLSLPDTCGIEAVDRLLAAHGETPIVVLTGSNDEAMALDALRHGVQDYLLKDYMAPGLLVRSLRHAAERHALRQQVQEAIKAKGAFLRNVSHEMRTPLTSIMGYAQALLDSDSELSADQQKDYLSSVVKNSRHLESLIEEMLDLGRLESDSLQLEDGVIETRELIHQAISTFSGACEERGLALSHTIDSVVPEAFCGDKKRLTQVLFNLIDNAVKFTDEGGISVRVLSERAELVGMHRLCIEIHDTGIGLSRADWDSMYQPFEQADGTLSRSRGGVGIGLTICKRLIELMKGRIEATRRPEGGSCFKMTLPVLAADKEQQPLESKPESPLRDLKILLVEDNTDTQKLVSHLLTRQEASLGIAQNGAEAIEMLGPESENPPAIEYDAILLDMQMPILDGYQTATRVRELGYQGPVLAITAHAMPGDREACLKVGCDDYLSKPFDAKDLYALLDKWCNAQKQEPVFSDC